MKVYCYHNFVPGLEDDALLELWKRSWKQHGWNAIILNENDARQADPEMFARFSKSPLLETRNPRGYTLAAMHRWVAMTRVTEPCVHVDIDVICNGFHPEDVIIHDPVPTFLAGSTCPCAVAASPRGWKLFTTMLELAPFLPRFDPMALAADSCDQYACSLIPEVFYYVQHLCKLYQEDEGWETAPMIHFPNRLTPYPRSETVRKWMNASVR